MRSVTIGGETRTINACPDSFVVYERNFAGTGHTLSEDINTFTAAVRSFNVMDFAVLPMDAVMRIEYTLESCVDGVMLPSFDVWVKQLPADAIQQIEGVLPDGWLLALFNELREKFFRFAAGEDVGAEGTGDEA